MNYMRIIFILVLLILATILSFVQAYADPILIKLTLEKASDYQKAASLGAVAYQRFDGFFLVEFEKTRLEDLLKAGLGYQIIDEEPWSEEYFLISPIEDGLKVDLQSYGRVLLEDQAWTLIKTSSERAFKLRGMRCWVTPIHHQPIPLRYKPTSRAVKEGLKYSSIIDSLLDFVSQDSLYAWDLRLQNFQTRYSYSDSIIKARDWLYDKLASFGIDSLWLHTYDPSQSNVVATVVGTASPDKVIVVGGHYDSIVFGGGTDPYTWAPGADDNGTGTAATLEMARIIASNPQPVTVMFVPFAQEEQGLIGSYYFAQYLHNHGTDVWLMINTDMIAHSVDVDPDVMIYAAPSAMGFVEIMTAMANTYTSLRPVYSGQSGGSDHYSFYEWGYDAVFASEGEFHTAGWHTNYDVVDSLNFPYMTEVTKACLATLLQLANAPSPVLNLEAQDAGDGHTLYLSWSPNPPQENVVYYKVHFGTKSGEYDSLHQVSALYDTLRNLQQDSTYFIALTAVNINNFESIANNEVSIGPRVAPLPPTGLAANPYGRLKIKLVWTANQEADLHYYNIYRSEDSLSGYQLLSDSCLDTTFVDSTVQASVEYYYYTVTAVDTIGNESQMSGYAQSFVATLDSGILLVDETYIDIGCNMVDGDSTNAFYDRALENYTYTYADHSCPTCIGSAQTSQISLKELTKYSVVIIHSEDNRALFSLGNPSDSAYAILRQYLSFGGKAIIEGRRALSRGTDYQCGILKFYPGNFLYDYIKVKSAYVPQWGTVDPYRSEEFIGAESQVSGYPELLVDSLKVAHPSCGLELLGRVPGVGYIDTLMTGEVIYTFRSVYDTSSSEGKPVAFRYLGSDYKVIYFDFPLYFIQEPQATQLLHKALSDLDVFTGTGQDQETQVPASFSLSQNYPNPFNLATTIHFTVGGNQTYTSTTLKIYNITGQLVKTLVDGGKLPGRHTAIWDGKDGSGEDVASGIYFYRLKVGEQIQAKKMLLLK